MASKTDGLRDLRELLENAQKRFEQYLDVTLKQIDRVEARFQRNLAAVKGADASLRRQMIRSDMNRLGGIRKKTQALRRVSRQNYKLQRGGVGTWDVDALAAHSGTRR